MRGDLVIARAYKGIPLIRRVWDADERGVYLTDDIHYEMLLAGKDCAPQLGFPREDVFLYDANLASALQDDEAGKNWRWEGLIPY
ncbi:MAG: hypothetical protein ACLP3B_01360 [Syntrophobacteraceae bacterium]